MKVIGCPELGVSGKKVKSIVNVRAETVTPVDPEPSEPLVSMAMAVTLYVPLNEKAVVNKPPEPLEGSPPGADQEKVKRSVPPVVIALQSTGVPAMADPHFTVTTIFAGLAVQLPRLQPFIPEPAISQG